MSNAAAAGLARRAATIAQVLVDNLDHPQLRAEDEGHLRKSLRVRNGERVCVIDGSGGWRLTEWRNDALEPVDAVQRVEAAAPVRVAFAVVKGERPEWTVQKLTELGVDRITLLTHTDRAVVRWDVERAEKSRQRLDRVAHEASMQSRRVRLPAVEIVNRLDDLGEGFAICHHDGEPLAGKTVSLATGPEGGWSERELSLGLARFGLGETVLRAETAAVTAGVRLCSIRAKSAVSPG